MRTLKKTLCLVLALVMVLGVCAMGASAEFTDAAEINYAEAVAVLSGIGVINGIEDADGNFAFQPAGTLTRAQAAKIIAYLLQADATELSSKTTFTDAQGHWAEGTISYAAAKGIVAGVGDNKFNPEGKLTGFAFAKMLLCALGYNAENEGLVGETWTIAVASLAKKTGILDGIAKFDGNADCSREQAAQMAYNALFVEMVEYAHGGTTITTGDVTITTGASAASGTGDFLVAEFGISGETDPASMVNPEDAYGRECEYEIYNADGEVIYNAYPVADFVYTSTANVTLKAVMDAYRKQAGLKATDAITVGGAAVTESDPVPAGFTLEFAVNPTDKKDLEMIATIFVVAAEVTDIKDAAPGSDYKKDIELMGSLMTNEQELTLDVKKGDIIALPAGLGASAPAYADAQILTAKQGTISAYNSTTGAVTIGGEKVVESVFTQDVDSVLGSDFKSTMDYYVVNGVLLYVAINTPAEEEYTTKVGYAISTQSVAYGAASTGDLLGAGAAAAKDGRAVVKMLDMDGKTTIYDLAVVTDAVAGTTSYTGKDSIITGVVATAPETPSGMFVEYYVKEDGTIVIVKATAPVAVKTVKATVNVDVDGATKKASSATVIKTVGDAASKYATAEIVGYKNFIDSNTDYACAYVVMDKADAYIETIYVVDVPAAPVVEAEVIYYISAQGDQTAAGYEYTAIVNGKAETIVCANTSTVAAGKYYTVAIVNGVVSSATEKTPTVDDATISAVDAAYIDTDAGVIEFAKTTATYDISGKNITALAKDVIVDAFTLADGSQIIFIVGKA